MTATLRKESDAADANRYASRDTAQTHFTIRVFSGAPQGKHESYARTKFGRAPQKGRCIKQWVEIGRQPLAM
ncbi:unnamed protein product [Boreogadus saida]